MLSKFTLGAIAALAASVSLSAQCYEPLTGASIGTGDDVVLPIQSLGFAFPFNGTTYTDVHVSTNGFVYLSNLGVPLPGGANCCAGTTATLVAGSPMISPFWSDLNMIAGTGSVLYNALPGKAVITWQNAVEYGTTAPTFSFQLTLDSSGVIQFAYDGRVQIATAGDYLVGMSEGAAAVVPPASDYSTVASSTTPTSFQLFNNVGLTFDLVGQTVQFVPTGLGYTWIPTACASSQASYGSGCYTLSDSLYQRFADAAVASAALTNQSVSFTPVGSSYLAVWGGGTYVAPSGTAVNLTAAAADDLEVVVTPSVAFPAPSGPQAQVRVHTNGLVSWGAAAQTFPGTNSYTPTPAGFLGGVNAGIYAWHDYNEAEAGSGRIKREEVVVGSDTVLMITWDNVENYSTPLGVNPSTMQIQMNLSTGVVTIVWTTVDSNTTSTFGSSHLVGYSAAGVSNDGGSVDLATSLPFLISSQNVSALALAAAPVVTTAGGTVTYTTNNIPEFAPTSGLFVAVHIISLGQVPAPGLDLGFLGAPGCSALIATLDFTQAMVGASNSQAVTFPFPAGLPVGFGIYSQSAALFAPNTLPNGQNAFGMTTSNGIASTIGAW
ncbi:MAG: hypothetical protein JNK15_00970 [Planctomycetes bacterium]|nr:hypothetical protein [Planctomycetota bacterium]